MSGRAATVNIIPGDYALSVGRADMASPPGWHWVSLGDIARLESGHTPSREHSEYWDGGIPWIGIRDARAHHGGTISTTFQTVTQAGLDNSAARLLPEGTVCLSRTASVGYVVVMGREMATSQDFVNWVCGPTIAPEFLQKLFVAENRSLFRFGKGSTHTTIYYPEVKAFHVCLPPLAEQRRIVIKLDSLQARNRRAREALDEVPALLEKLRQSILAAAFRGDLTKDWRAKNPDVEPAEKLLQRIRAERRKKWEESELTKLKSKGKPPTDDRWKAKYTDPEVMNTDGLPELPSSWCWASLDELSHRVTDGTHQPPTFTTNGVPFLVIANVIAGQISWDGVTKWVSVDTYRSLTERCRPERGDILYTAVGSYGVAIEVDSDQDFVFQRHIAHIKPVRPQLIPSFVAAALNSPLCRTRADSVARGVAQKTVTLGELSRFPLPLAPLAEQMAIVATISAALRRLEAISGTVETLALALGQVDKSTLSKAFRGELVPQDPNDEPADVMLARLRSSAVTPGSAPASSPSPAKRRGRPRKP